MSTAAGRPKTPEGSGKTSLKSTPRSKKSTGDGHKVTDTRNAIATEMDSEMLVCSVDSFQQSYLPFVPSPQEVAGCVQLLCNEGLLVEKAGGLQWKDFPDSPSQLATNEKDTFKHLKTIAEAISKYELSDRGVQGRVAEPRVEYRDCPDDNVLSELYGATFKIDACFELAKGSQLARQGTKLAAPNIAVSAEFKKYEKDWVDNRQKLVSGASHIMNDDPRRIFMFSFTIEDEKMALWYFSRSYSSKSRDFNFLRDYKRLIAVFLSFIFADESRLGYDSTVHRRVHEGISYTYEIGVEGTTRYFESRRSLASYRSLGITGRMTRVWEAIEVSKPGGRPLPGKKKVALKDVWLEEDAMSEKAIQGAIFAEVEKQKELKRNGQASRLDLIEQWNSMTSREILKRIEDNTYRGYFVGIEDDHQGLTTRPVPQGATPTTGLFFSDKPRDGELTSYRIPGSHPTRDRGNVTRPIEPKAGEHRSAVSRAYKPKRRYIIVYSEVCTALHDAVDLSTSFLALADASVALVILFVAGWVHRDVSTGNILIFRDEQGRVKGKLSDLEYAKQFGSTGSSSDPKTGTPYFMPVEILSGSAILGSTQSGPPGYSGPVEDDYWVIRDSTDGVAKMLGQLQLSHGETGDRSYNFQHDLESLFWIALWLVTARVNHEPSQRYARSIYVNELGATYERIRVLQSSSRLQSKLSEHLHPTLQSMIITLAGIVRILFNSYFARDQANQTLEIASYASVYPSMLGSLFALFSFSRQIEGNKAFPGLIDVCTKKPIQSQPSPALFPGAEPQAGPSNAPLSAHGTPEVDPSTTFPSMLETAASLTSATDLASENTKRPRAESGNEELPAPKRSYLPGPAHVLRSP